MKSGRNPDSAKPSPGCIGRKDFAGCRDFGGGQVGGDRNSSRISKSLGNWMGGIVDGLSKGGKLNARPLGAGVGFWERVW